MSDYVGFLIQYDIKLIGQTFLECQFQVELIRRVQIKGLPQIVRVNRAEPGLVQIYLVFSSVLICSGA